MGPGQTQMISDDRARPGEGTAAQSDAATDRCGAECGESRRIDTESGATEITEFVGAGSRIFTSLHIPPGDIRGAVVVCSPFQAEFLKNYRREVLLARRLAAAGWAVQRFHYRGTGNSDGESPTLDTMCSDAAAATDHLQQACRPPRLAFVGARFGGLVATVAANSYPGAALALWEPVTDTRTYLRELFRVRMIRELKDGVTERATAEGLLETLHAEGTVDIIGFSVDLPFVTAAGERKLGDQLTDATRPVLLVQCSRSDRVREPHRKLSEAWENAGATMTVTTAGDEETWWFESDVFHTEEDRPLTQRLVSITTDWITGLEQP